MLSKKERKYRSKIIAENHLKKDMQKYLDEYIKSKSLAYKYVYVNSINIRIQYAFAKISNTVKSVSSSLVKATNSVKKLAASVERFCKKVANT